MCSEVINRGEKMTKYQSNVLRTQFSGLDARPHENRVVKLASGKTVHRNTNETRF